MQSLLTFCIKRPALSYKIAQDFFENNLSEQGADYTLENGFYTRRIGEDGLTLSFSDTEDGKNIRNSIKRAFTNISIIL